MSTLKRAPRFKKGDTIIYKDTVYNKTNILVINGVFDSGPELIYETSIGGILVSKIDATSTLRDEKNSGGRSQRKKSLSRKKRRKYKPKTKRNRR